MSGIVLIIASSARMLLQAASDQGYKAVAIDCFADVDSRQLATELVKVDSLCVTEVKKALIALQQTHLIHIVIYGSGLESEPETLQYLQQHYHLLGNSFEIVSYLLNKPEFFAFLKKQHIFYPETVFDSPEATDGWLMKPYAAEGGIGIQWAENASSQSGHYWQQYCAGDSCSVLFLANGREFQIIGFHKQLLSRRGKNAFIFSGLINQFPLQSWLQPQIADYLGKLLSEYPLKGLNSLDFIVKHQRCYVLEVNPRPSASLALYDSSLVRSHIASCQSEGSLDSIAKINSFKAYQIIFADNRIIIPLKFPWPQWVSDRPQAASIINTDEPICSIIACGKTEQQVMYLLKARAQQLLKLIHSR